MAEDFRIRIGFFRHHKALKLVRRLGLEGLVALLRLWAYAAEFHTNGDLAGMTAEDIELAPGGIRKCPSCPSSSRSDSLTRDRTALPCTTGKSTIRGLPRPRNGARPPGCPGSTVRIRGSRQAEG
jgi:hypothetical protein